MNMKNNYLRNMDGQAGRAGVPSNSVDLVLTDPTRGIEAEQLEFSFTQTAQEDDELIAELDRIMDAA